MHLLINGVGRAPEAWSTELLSDLSNDLVEAAEMHKFAGPEVVENGNWIMAITLIAESHVALHLNRATGAAYVDVFSCKAVPPIVTGLVLERLDLVTARVERLARVELN